MHPPLDQDRIEKFLSALGRESKVKVKVHLAGGAALVWLALKTETEDVDLSVDAKAEDLPAFMAALRTVQDRLQVAVEERSPADFVPLPSGARERATWVAKFGMIDVYLYDAVSTVLAKVHRGTDADFADVLAMIKRGLVTREALQKGYEEILPKMGAESLKQDPPPPTGGRKEAVNPAVARGEGAVAPQAPAGSEASPPLPSAKADPARLRRGYEELLRRLES
jgi:hypothetical protein